MLLLKTTYFVVELRTTSCAPKAKVALLRSPLAGVLVPHPQVRDGELGEGNTQCALGFPGAAMTLTTIAS